MPLLCFQITAMTSILLTREIDISLFQSSYIMIGFIRLQPNMIHESEKTGFGSSGAPPSAITVWGILKQAIINSQIIVRSTLSIVKSVPVMKSRFHELICTLFFEIP